MAFCSRRSGGRLLSRTCERDCPDTRKGLPRCELRRTGVGFAPSERDGYLSKAVAGLAGGRDAHRATGRQPRRSQAEVASRPGGRKLVFVAACAIRARFRKEEGMDPRSWMSRETMT